MTAQIISRSDFLWKRVERDIDAFLDDRGRDNELGNVGRFLHTPETFGEVDAVRGAWAEARKVKAEMKQKEGA